jgi:hypothetical protein
MIDVMDKHFQEELHLSLSQSAWVQFTHYLGYFIMALPACWLATKLDYKGGIITGGGRIAVYPSDAHRRLLGIFAWCLRSCRWSYLHGNHSRALR